MGRGGSQALIFSTKGWSGKSDITGWPIEKKGEKPPIDRLIEEYAEVTDEEYGRMILSESNHTGDEERKNYIRGNKKRLLEGLVGEMEARLEEIKNPRSE